jgi:hypothetical protein
MQQQEPGWWGKAAAGRARYFEQQAGGMMAQGALHGHLQLQLAQIPWKDKGGAGGVWLSLLLELTSACRGAQQRGSHKQLRRCVWRLQLQLAEGVNKERELQGASRWSQLWSEALLT